MDEGIINNNNSQIDNQLTKVNLMPKIFKELPIWASDEARTNT